MTKCKFGMLFFSHCTQIFIWYIWYFMTVNCKLSSLFQESSEAKIHSRASTVSRAATGWRSHGAVSRHSTAYREFPPMTALTQRTTPPHCTDTNQRVPSKTTYGSDRTSAKTNQSSRQLRSLDTQVSINRKSIIHRFWTQCADDTVTLIST